jgi:hypothetical protein
LRRLCVIGRVCASGGAVRGACEIGRTKPFRLKSKELGCGCGWMWGAGEVLIAATNETGMADGARPWGMDVGARIGAGDSPEVFCRSKPISYKGFIVIVLHAIHCASDQVSGDSRLETESRQRGGCAPGVSRRVWGRIFGCQRPCGDLALAGRLREANAGDPFLPDVRVARRRPGFG